MEKDSNPFPKMELFNPIERAKKVAHFIFDRFYGDVPSSASDHYRGGAAMLDRELYDKLDDTVEFEPIQDTLF